MKNKYVLSTNKLLYDLFNHHFEDSEIKTEKVYENNELVERHYVEFLYESSNSSSFKVRISSINKDNLTFTIYERMLYLILISNARQSDGNNYFITMRKIRSIRGLKENGSSTYKCYELALERLASKTIKIMPHKNSSHYRLRFFSCSLLSVSNLVVSNGRIKEFNYSFGNLDTSFIKNSQKFTTYYNPFNIIFKKYFVFQIGLHLIRLIAINQKKYKKAEYSYQRMLKQIFKVDVTTGVIDSQTYYDYLATSGNKQSIRLKQSYEELEMILKQFVKLKIIQGFCISKQRTFKYLRDDEVKILIKFIGE